MSDLDALIRRTFKPPKEEKRDSLAEYPIYTSHSPRSINHEYEGKIVSRKGKRKLVLSEPKPYQPLKHDTDSGYGEKRKRYIR